MTCPRLPYLAIALALVLLLALAGSSSATPTVIIFNTTGTTNWTVPTGVTAVDYLVVAGGGGGGSNGGGGGGAGGYRTGTMFPVSGSYSITVGSGGAGSTSASTPGQNGTNSAFGSIIALGGGGGGSGSTGISRNGLPGGSGGGASATGTPGSGASGQGNAGGYGDTPGGSQRCWGGGGGGAGAAGGNATKNAYGGAGGNGLVSSITGVSVAYAGGGGGGAYSNLSGTGGTGGGGNGGLGAAPGQSGQPNTGGGGGGGGANANGGAGGSGIVIIRYVIPTVTNVTPANGPLEGGTNVTITGSGFTGVTDVRFGSTPASSFTLVSDSTILAISPPGATAGTVNVTVTTPYGTSVAGPGSTFTYLTAEITVSIHGTITNWSLEIGENIDSSNLTLRVTSTQPWSVSVYDALDLGKPPETAGHMAEFGGSFYNPSGRMLSSPVQVKNASAPSYITVSNISQTYLSGNATPAEGVSLPIDVRQVVDYEDAILSPPSVYQIIITFIGTTT